MTVLHTAQLCPGCRRPLPEVRLGVVLTPLKAHVWQINDRLTESGYQIVGRGGYRLQKLRRAAP